MSRTPITSAALDAQIVDQMMNSRGTILGVTGGVAGGMLVTAAVMLVVGMAGFHPMTTFAMAFFIFLMAAGMSMWSYGEYLTLISIDERRREAEQG
jgi:hypothetical protein